MMPMPLRIDRQMPTAYDIGGIQGIAQVCVTGQSSHFCPDWGVLSDVIEVIDFRGN